MVDLVDRNQLVSLAADIVSAYVANNPVPASDLPILIDNIHRSLTLISSGQTEPAADEQKPAVPVKKSVQQDYLICLEDGKKFKSLKRHLSVHYGLSPDEYRAKWNLPANYPMVAPNYAAARSALAIRYGLGRSKSKKPASLPTKRRRKTAPKS